ncbi:MAG: hypothetical protein ACLT0Y_01235 [Christensenellales bacterium]
MELLLPPSVLLLPPPQAVRAKIIAQDMIAARIRFVLFIFLSSFPLLIQTNRFGLLNL